MKKVLIATDGFLPRWDGISSFLNELIPRLEEEYKLTVIAPDMGEYKSKFKAKIIRFPTVKLRLGDNYNASLVNIFKMAKHIKKSDLVWVQCLGPIGIWGVILGKLYKKPVMMYNHLLEWEVYAKSQRWNFFKVPINVITKAMSRLLYNRCDLIIVPSLEQLELLSIMGIKSNKKVIHLGVDTKQYSPENKAVAKHNIGIDPVKFVVGYGGRLSYEKDLKTLYRAFIRLQKKYKEILLLIAGGGHPELERLFSDKENIILTGTKDNLAPYYQAMDVYVLPSLVETTSLTTLEAMSCGTAIVATPVGFIKEYVNDGENGFLFPKKNSYVLFKKIEYLKKHENTRKKVARNGREMVVKDFSWDNTAQGIKTTIEELIPLKN